MIFQESTTIANITKPTKESSKVNKELVFNCINSANEKKKTPIPIIERTKHAINKINASFYNSILHLITISSPLNQF